LAALSSGLITFAAAWPRYGLAAFLIACAVSSAAALFVGLLLALIGKNERHSAGSWFNLSDLVKHQNKLREKQQQKETKKLYFDIERVHVMFRDETGVETDDLEFALDEARSVIREVADEVAADHPGETFFLVVRDEDGSAVMRIPVKKIRPEMGVQQRSA
jgi:hypothetical protein